MRSAIRTITRRSTTNWPLWTSCHKARLNRNQRIVLGETVGTDGTEIAGLPPLNLTCQTRMPDSPDNADSVIVANSSMKLEEGEDKVKGEEVRAMEEEGATAEVEEIVAEAVVAINSQRDLQ